MLKGILYRKKTMEQDILQAGRIVLPFSLLPAAIAFYHWQNHAGASTIRNLLWHSYYHPKLLFHTQRFVSSCYLCLIHRPLNNRQPLAEHPYYAISKSSLWSLDIVSGLPISYRYKSVISIVDHYSQYLVIHPLKYETADEICDILIQRVFSVFPIPEILQSDNAANLLRSKKMQAIAYFYNIKIHLISPYSSISNGKIEIYNRKSIELLAKLNDEFDRPWPKLIPLVQICLNAKPIKSLGGKSPCEVMFGVQNQTRLSYTYEEKEIIG